MKKKVNIALKTIMYIALSIIFVVILTFAYTSYKYDVPNIFGYKFLIIVSGSMEPTLNSGDVVVIKDTKNIKVNDIVSFKFNGSIITHRVKEIITDKSEIKIITKGDANNTIDDKEMLLNDIEGKYVFKISKIGNAILFLKTREGLITLMVVFGVLITFTVFKKKKNNNSKHNR